MKFKKLVSVILTLSLCLSFCSVASAANNVSFEKDNVQYTVVGESEVEVSGVSGSVTSITIPAVVENGDVNYSVVSVSQMAFVNTQSYVPNTTLTEITFGANSNVEEIGVAAFANCTALTSITLPDCEVSIGDAVFANCTSLESVEIPAHATLAPLVFGGHPYFGNSQFYGDVEITFAEGSPYQITDGILYDETSLLYVYDESVENVNVPEGITTIDKKAFAGNKTLKSITLPTTVTDLESATFQNCTALESVTLLGDIQQIGAVTFDGCTSLKTVQIPDSVVKIETNAFRNCSALEAIDLPEGLMEIGDNAFENCSSLKRADLPSSLTTLGELAFSNCGSLTQMNIPSSVAEIPFAAFGGCVSLESINISSGVTSIGDYAFDLTIEKDDVFVNEDPKLSYINIPSTVTSIAENFLGGVKSDGGTALIFEGDTLPDFDEDALIGLSDTEPIICFPAGAKEAYIGSDSPLKDLASEDGAYGLSLANSGLTKSATYNPSITVPTGANVVCSSTDENVATVSYNETDKKVVVTGVDAGTADITVKMSINGFTLLYDTCTVTVTENGAVIPTVEEPEVEIPTGATIQDGKTDSVKSSAGTTEIKNSTLTDAAALEAATTTASEKNAAISQAQTELGTGVSAADLKIYTQTYLDIQPTAYSETTSGNKTTVSLTLEITPMVRTVASTASNSNDIVIKDSGTTGDANAVVATGSEKPLNIGSATKISIDLGELSDAFKNDTIYIKHEKNGHNYFYQAKSDANGKLEFTSKHGFSPFTFSLTSQAVATIGEGDNTVGYETFADAVADVQNGETITVVNGAGDLTASMSGSSKTITVQNGTESEIKVKVNGDEQTIAAGGTQSFSYTRPSSGGPSNATLTFETNGGTAIAKVTKAVGTTIDLTDYEPTREGYTFDGWYSDKELTKEITSIKLSSSMTVYAKWTKGHDCPSAHFTDVDTNQWYHESVDYVVENGLMQGTSKTTFAPNLTTTRGMIVTILYRLENEPSVSGACPFDDVQADSWYEDAVTWAAANKIVDGYGDAKFGPEDNITREQMAAILYRYAQFKGYGVTESAELDSFTDAAQVSDWAKTAMQWACGESLIQGDAGKLMPTGNATRAQVAAILMRYCENIAK